MGETLHDKSRFYCLMVAGGVLLSTMDSSMLNVALPAIMRDFGVGLHEVKQVVLVYLLIITVSLVFWGRISDQFGKGKIYLSGMTVFVCGAIGCSLSASFGFLLLSRAVQATGASMMMSTGPAIVKLTTPREHLGKTLGLIGMATSCGLMSGPVVSGSIIAVYSWREVFYVSVPLAVVAVGLGTRYLLHDLDRSVPRTKSPFDWRGGALWVAMVAAFVLLANGSFTGWQVNGVLLVVLVAMLLLFLKTENNSTAPVLPLELVRERYFWTSAATSAISFAALFIVMILLPFYLDYILNYSADRIGYTMMALPVSLVVVSPLSGWLYDRWGSARFISTFGLTLCCIAVLCLMDLDRGSSFGAIFWRLGLLGAGQSIFLSPNSASVLSRVQDTYSGITSGILATARNFGMLTGTALAGTSFGLFFGRITGGLNMKYFGPEDLEHFLRAHRLSLALALLLLVAGCVLSWQRGR